MPADITIPTYNIIVTLCPMAGDSGSRCYHLTVYILVLIYDISFQLQVDKRRNLVKHYVYICFNQESLRVDVIFSPLISVQNK